MGTQRVLGEAGFTSPVTDADCAGHGKPQGVDAPPKLHFPGDFSKPLYGSKEPNPPY